MKAEANAPALELDDLDAANKNLILALQQMQPTGDPEIDAQWRYQVKQQFADNATRRRTIAAELEAHATRVALPPSHPAHSPGAVTSLSAVG